LRKRIDYTWLDPYGWYGGVETRYLYDGMRVIQERDSSNTPTVGYTRGLDLSGTLESAGGIGGLLGRSHTYSSGSFSTHNCYQADGGGNVTYIVNSSQSSVATYKYDPYGNTISSSGSLASANVYRFSSKPVHVSSGMYYYGYRFYDSTLQRWPNRDPMGEHGGINLYGFVANAPSEYVDFWGLRKDPVCANQCHQDLSACYSAAKIAEFGLGGGAIGAGLQGLNKTALKPRAGVAGGGPSGRYTSWTRKCLGDAGKGLGRISIRGAGAIGAGVGMLGLHAQCLGAFAGCMSGCPDISTVPSTPTPPIPPSMPYFPPYRP
jgi:RHS repeat-associated protein